MTINIFQVPEGTNINIGCGCGTGGNGGSGSGGVGVEQPPLPPGGTAGGDYTDRARVIDICRNAETIFQDPINDWVDTVQQNGYFPGLGIDAVDQTLVGVELIDAVQESLVEVQAELYGDKWTAAFKKWIVTYFDDPFPGFSGGFASINGRRELVRLARKAPLLVAGAPFSATLIVWAATADIAALNARIKSSAGTASYVGECADLQREAGREPYQPPASENLNAEEFTTTQGYLVRYYSINAAVKDEDPRYLDQVPDGYELVAYAGSMRKARSSATARGTMSTLQGDGTETLAHDTWFTNEDDDAEWNEVYENIPLMDDVMNEVYDQFGDGRVQTKITGTFVYANPTQYGWRVTNDDTTVQVNDYAFVFREVV